MNPHRPPNFYSRRDMLKRAGLGLGTIALADLFGGHASGADFANPLTPRPAPYPAKATSIIWLFQEGGPSSFDLFDPKPELDRQDGKPLAGADPFFGSPGPLMRSPYRFAQYGESGAWVSNALPHLTECVDDLAFIKAAHCESNSHAPAMYQMNTGYVRPGFPSAGSWLTYGLGSENSDLPGFVVLPKQTGTKGGALNWGAGFLPGTFQGTLFRGGKQPILNLKRPRELTDRQQRAQLDLALKLNAQHLDRHPEESDLEARIASFELAYRMQFEASKAVDLSQETAATKQLYGIDDDRTRDYGTKLLLARRLVERGVRFVQAYPADQWDAHNNLKHNHDSLAGMTDKPVAGLLKDLKQRGLLDSTLVIWGGEFGRLPISQAGRGRDHNPYGFGMWLAGGGIKGGVSHGQTDEIGYKAVADTVTVPDIHATILHLMGINHEKLTYVHDGRPFRLTDVSGEVIQPLLA